MVTKDSKKKHQRIIMFDSHPNIASREFVELITNKMMNKQSTNGN